MNNCFILGAGGHTRSLMALIGHLAQIQITGIYDDSYDDEKQEIILDAEVKGKISDLPETGKLIISYGALEKRELLFKKYNNRILEDNLIHPTSFIEENVTIGTANQIFSNSYINACSEIGNNNIINTGCIIEHENIIGNHCHISIGTVLGGRVTIGDKVFIGAGSVVKDKISICSNVTIGANSTVIRDIETPGTYVGTPARRIK
jgi:UDP-N-acetylbacillosamine N-acetyltransferase